MFSTNTDTWASSHREAPLIANDPLADNTDLYAFRSPDNPDMVTIIANYIPGQLPQAGPNWYTFGENIRYEIHIDNDINTAGDDIIYRATFSQVNEDPTTFFYIRLGAENLKTTYTLERSMDGGSSFQTIVTDGVVPPPNIGPRSIEGGAGLGASSYESLIASAITTASSGETVYCGPAEDPFFVDLGAVFDLGNLPRLGEDARDGLAGYNVHSIALQIPISTLQKDGKDVSEATDILDGDFVVGVWASASRPMMRTLQTDGSSPVDMGDWVQVSRLGMPLTNEAVIPIGSKDEWNFLTPYNENPAHFEFFYNPELGLYMDDALFGGAVPSLAPLRIQKSSLAGLFGPTFPGFDFSNGADGLFGLKGSAAVAGTALDDAVFGTLLLPAAGKPRSVDLWPAFHTGVPNFPPYQLATGKMGNPLNAGKPFINNFLPNGGDMLRLNMAVPPTPRASAAFSSLGLINAAVLGLTDPTYANTNIEFIPNMDGFPNGRRLEDDVTRIELQAVAGAVLAAVGLWYDDYDATDAAASPVTNDLLGVLTYSTGVDNNDVPFKSAFPYLASPSRGTEVSNPNDPVASQTGNGGLYVSNTANPGVSIYQPSLSDIDQTISVDTDQADGNGVVVDETTNRLIQLSRATSTIKIFDNASSVKGSAMPVSSFTDPGMVSGREIAYDAANDIIYVADHDAGVSAILAYDAASTLSGTVSPSRVLTLNGRPWGISYDAANDRMYVAKDLTDMFQTYDNISAAASGMLMPTVEASLAGMTRVHGIHYNAASDILFVTEITDASGGNFDTDGGIHTIEDASTVVAGSPTMVTATRIIAGPMTLLGNPVDVDYNAGNVTIFIAEKTKGGFVLGFDINDSGDVAPSIARTYAVPEDIYFAPSSGKLYASNTANPGVAVFSMAFSNWVTAPQMIASGQADGNGIAYDESNGYVIQLSRADRSVKVFDDMGNLVTQFTDPAITSGREIALDKVNNVLYVASNSDSKILAYDNPYMMSGTVSASRTLNLNGQPWGITYDPAGDRLFVAKDLTDAFQVYNNPASLDGTVMPDSEISIVGATRTHGITYSPILDVLVVTEIGAASGGAFNTDGGYYLFGGVSGAIASGATSITPTRSVIGANTKMGNPVDVAIDDRDGGHYIYIAEKTNGGSLLIFDAAAMGDVAPNLFVRYAVPEDIYLDTTGPTIP